MEKWKPCGPLCPTCHKPKFGKRHDAFNFCDILAIRPDVGIVAIQSTVGGHHSDHMADLVSNPLCKLWLLAGGRIVLMSWSKRKIVKKDGKLGKGERWMPRWIELTLDQFPTGLQPVPTQKGGDAIG